MEHFRFLYSSFFCLFFLFCFFLFFFSFVFLGFCFVRFSKVVLWCFSNTLCFILIIYKYVCLRVHWSHRIEVFEGRCHCNFFSPTQPLHFKHTDPLVMIHLARNAYAWNFFKKSLAQNQSYFLYNNNIYTKRTILYHWMQSKLQSSYQGSIS